MRLAAVYLPAVVAESRSKQINLANNHSTTVANASQRRACVAELNTAVVVASVQGPMAARGAVDVAPTPLMSACF